MEADEDMEQQLKEQLAEQREALSQIHEAMKDSEDQELSAMSEALQEAIAELEAALLGVTKARLLASLEVVPPSSAQQAEDDSAGPGPSSSQCCTIPEGAECRFRADNGRWYPGVLRKLEGQWAHVTYARPTLSHMLQGCRVPASSLRPARPAAAASALASCEVGDVVYLAPACMERGDPAARQAAAGLPRGLWPEAEVVEVARTHSKMTVQLVQVVCDQVVRSSHDGCSDLDSEAGASSSSSSEGSDAGSSMSISEDDAGEEPECVAHSGLGSSLDVFEHARLALAAGIHTGTKHFAAWETHTRGIASKLMARMGYKPGTGLGVSGGGLAVPVDVVLLPARQGLGVSAGKTPDGHKQGTGTKRKRRGGERSRRKKHAAAQKAAKAAANEVDLSRDARGEEPGLFGFINNALGDRSEAAAKIRAVDGALLKQGPTAGSQGSKRHGPASGKHLIDQHHAIEKCHAKVAHFQAMFARNSSNAGLAPQIRAQLEKAQAELASAQAEQARMNHAVKAADHNKAMMKF